MTFEQIKKLLLDAAAIIAALGVIAGAIAAVSYFFMVPWLAKRLVTDPDAKRQLTEWVNDTTQEILSTDETIKKNILLNIENYYHHVTTESSGAYFLLEDTSEYVMPIYVPESESGKKRDVKLHLIMAHYGAGKEELRKGKILINNEIEVKNFDFSKIDHAQTTTWDLSQSVEDARKSGSYPDRDESIFTVVFRPDPTQTTEDVISVIALINVMGLSTDDAVNSTDVKQ